MRNPLPEEVEKCRIANGSWGSTAADGCNGAFDMRIIGNQRATVICSDGGGWDHVSMSLIFENRAPTWREMCYLKDLFFREEETVLQYHPAKEDYVNYHPNCLHLWRPQNDKIPTPPTWMIGPRTKNDALGGS